MKNRENLVRPALLVAKRAGSAATSVEAVMKDPTFRMKGLLPCFAAANRQIAASAQASIAIFILLLQGETEACSCLRGYGA